MTMQRDYLYNQQKALDNQDAVAMFENVLRSVSIQAFNVIIACGIRDLDGMLSITEDQLRMIKGVKPGTVQEILRIRDELRQKQQINELSGKQKRNESLIRRTSQETDSRNSETVKTDFNYSSTIGEDTRKNKYEWTSYSTTVGNSDKKETSVICCQMQNLKESAKGSILRKALRNLYVGVNIDEAEFYEGTELIQLSMLGLSEQDLWKLRAVALFPEDSLANISSLTISYIIETGISDEAFSALLQGLNKAFAHSQESCFAVGQLDESSIICDSDVQGIANLRLSAFGVPKKIVALMRDMGIITWCDIVGHSERDIISMYGISVQSLRCIHYLWLLRKYAEEIRLKMTEKVYSSFESLVNYYIGLGATTSRQKTIIRGRLGFLDGRQWTLEELGNIEGITRERVRQIEKKCIKKLQHRSNKEKLQPLWEAASHILECSGGICLASELAESLANLWLWPSVPPGESVAVLVGVSKIFQVIREPRLSIMMESSPCVNCLRVEQMLTRAIDVSQGILAVQEAGRILSEHCKCECRVDTVEVASFSCGYVLHVAERSNIIKTDGNYLYNQIAWVYRYGQRNEIIEAIMQNCTHAMHFTEVYQKIREMRLDDESLSERYIHACMSNSPVLLLWDRGTFIHRSHVVIPYGLIHEIENCILER